jgi:iron complex transport system permease protein
MSEKKSRWLQPFLLIVLFGVVVFSINIGSYQIPLSEIVQILIDGLIRVPRIDDAFLVIWRIRLPRIIMASLAGYGLAVCGSVMQSVLDNPMASPYTLGISSGASFGAALAILLNISLVEGQYFIVFNAFVFALITSFIVFSFSSRFNASPETMVLTGIGLAYLFSAFTILLEYFSSPEAVYNLQFWINGSLGKATWSKIILVAFVQLLSIPVLYLKALDLDVMAYGGEQATSLGVDVRRTRILSAGLVSVIAASIVSFTGVIGFIGLVSPHLARILLGNENRRIMIYGGVIGAILLVVSDMVSSQIMAPLILPIGAITSLLGAPFFIYLIQKRRKFNGS